MENISLESFDNDDNCSNCSFDFSDPFIDHDVLNETWLNKCLTDSIKKIFVDKIFEYETKNCVSCQINENKGHVCFEEFKTIACISFGNENPAYRFAEEICEELLETKEITSKQAFSLLSLCKSNRFDFPYYRLFEWKAIKKQ